jgi:hypothetical protein
MKTELLTKPEEQTEAEIMAKKYTEVKKKYSSQTKIYPKTEWWD